MVTAPDPVMNGAAKELEAKQQPQDNDPPPRGQSSLQTNRERGFRQLFSEGRGRGWGWGGRIDGLSRKNKSKGLPWNVAAVPCRSRQIYEER